MRRALIAISFVIPLVAACSAPAVSSPSSDRSSPTLTPVPTESPSSWDVLPEPVPHSAAATPNDELRDELLAMLAEDQAVRTGIPLPGDDRTAEELFADMGNVDARNSARMREILDEFGWPGWSLVGRHGSEAAWALIQHADLQADLQERGLAMLRGAVEADDASPGDLAYLIDRVLVAQGLPQLYGTQIGAGPDGEVAPRTPIEDEANVDARRAAAGLGTLEAYYEEIRRSFEEVEPSPSASP